MSADAFASIAARYLADPRVSDGTGFGTKPGLRVDGHIFVMHVRGGLGVKLPAARVTGLVAEGIGTPMSTRPNRPMREWIAVPDPGRWDDLVAESFAFVGGVDPDHAGD